MGFERVGSYVITVSAMQQTRRCLLKLKTRTVDCKLVRASIIFSLVVKCKSLVAGFVRYSQEIREEIRHRP
jgi:hypothetical protein